MASERRRQRRGKTRSAIQTPAETRTGRAHNDGEHRDEAHRDKAHTDKAHTDNARTRNDRPTTRMNGGPRGRPEEGLSAFPPFFSCTDFAWPSSRPSLRWGKRTLAPSRGRGGAHGGRQRCNGQKAARADHMAAARGPPERKRKSARAHFKRVRCAHRSAHTAQRTAHRSARSTPISARHTDQRAAQRSAHTTHTARHEPTTNGHHGDVDGQHVRLDPHPRLWLPVLAPHRPPRARARRLLRAAPVHGVAGVPRVQAQRCAARAG